MVNDRWISRRTFLTGAAAGAAAVAAGTGGQAFAAGSRGAPAVLRYYQQAANIPTPRAQTLVVSQSTNQVWDSFNPFTPNGEAYQYGVEQACREHLFYANFVQGKIQNCLGTKWAYNPDFTQLTLSLNPAAKWSDGQPFTADDVKYTCEMLLKNGNLNGSDYLKPYVETITAPNPQTVVIKMKTANPRFHYNFISGIVHPNIIIVPKHIWEKQDPTKFANNPPIYTGPYVLDKALPNQFMNVWKRNPNYWNKAELDPKPQYVIYRQFLPPDAEQQDFVSGNVDIPSIPYLNMVPLQDSFKDWELFKFSDPCPRGMWLNQDSKSGLFQTAAGRRAMSYLLDRKTIGQTIWQPPTPPAQYPWSEWSANDKWKAPDVIQQYPLEFSIDEAEKLLDQAGAKKVNGKRQLNGKNISLDIVTPATTADAEYQIGVSMAGNLKKVGIDAQTRALPGTPWTDAYQLGNYDISSHWVCGVAFDPAQLYVKFLTQDYKPVGQRAQPDHNETRTRIPELNDIALQLDKVNPEDPKNKPLFDKGLMAFMSNLPAIPSVQTTYPFAFGTKYWKGWPTEQNDYNIAANWWAQFKYVIGTIQPAGS